MDDQQRPGEARARFSAALNRIGQGKHGQALRALRRIPGHPMPSGVTPEFLELVLELDEVAQRLTSLDQSDSEAVDATAARVNVLVDRLEAMEANG